jgi:hypothetical protein
MQTLKLSVTVTLDDDIAKALKQQKGYTDRHIEQIVKNELQHCPSESGLIAEIEIEKE